MVLETGRGHLWCLCPTVETAELERRTLKEPPRVSLTAQCSKGAREEEDLRAGDSASLPEDPLTLYGTHTSLKELTSFCRGTRDRGTHEPTRGSLLLVEEEEGREDHRCDGPRSKKHLGRSGARCESRRKVAVD